MKALSVQEIKRAIGQLETNLYMHRYPVRIVIEYAGNTRVMYEGKHEPATAAKKIATDDRPKKRNERVK